VVYLYVKIVCFGFYLFIYLMGDLFFVIFIKIVQVSTKARFSFPPYQLL